MAKPIKIKFQNDIVFDSLSDCRNSLQSRCMKTFAQTSFNKRANKLGSYNAGTNTINIDLPLDMFKAEVRANEMSSASAILYEVSFKLKKGIAIYVGITQQAVFARIEQHIADAYSGRAKSQFHRYLMQYFGKRRPSLEEFKKEVDVTYGDWISPLIAIKQETESILALKISEKAGELILLNTAPGGSLSGRIGSVKVGNSYFAEYIRKQVNEFVDDEKKKANIVSQVSAAYYRRRRSAFQLSCIENWDIRCELDRIIGEIKKFGRIVPSDADIFVYKGVSRSIHEIAYEREIPKGAIKSALVCRKILSGSEIDICDVLDNPKDYPRTLAMRQHSFMDFLHVMNMGLGSTLSKKYLHVKNKMDAYVLSYWPSNRHSNPNFSGFATYLGKPTKKTAFFNHASKDNIDEGLALFLKYVETWISR